MTEIRIPVRIRFRSWLNETFDRPSLADAGALAAGFFVLYLLTLMPGPAWGVGAVLQHRASYSEESLLSEKTGEAGKLPETSISSLYTGPAGFFARLFPFGDLAWRVNLFGALLMIAALVVVYFAARLLVSNRLAAIAAAVALGFSPAFFLHAVTPTAMPLALLLQAVSLHELIRVRLTESRVAFGFALAAAALAAALMPESSAGIVVPVILAADRSLSKRGPAVIGLLVLAVAAITAGLSEFGFFAATLLFVFLLLQFPFVGWILLGWGAAELSRRARGVRDLLIVSLAASIPHASGVRPEELFGAMLPALAPAALILAAGVDHVRTRLARRREAIDIAPALLLTSLALCPLLTAGSVAYTARASGFETRLAVERAHWVDLRGNAWHDAVLYSLWPPKNGEGSGEFLLEAERDLPAKCVLVVDPAIAPALRFAQDVEGRLMGVRAMHVDPAGQVVRLSTAAAEGARIFLAGTDPEFYDVPGMALIGDLVPSGRFLEWIPTIPLHPDSAARPAPRSARGEGG
jgi:hypothetical protein